MYRAYDINNYGYIFLDDFYSSVDLIHNVLEFSMLS